ncbi:MAG: YihA family ribosome biogenesis GTP-binding protein [Alphaproteobacteria bacterium]|nr:YihA family ribosome biogenesis GTP-binding protein [Alphaproteobacteria bacterium]
MTFLTLEEQTEKLKKEGNDLFIQKPTFLRGVASVDQLPTTNVAEFAFAGRSNVGKSSLINAVTGVRGLARASNTPGRTQELNFFDANNQFFIVDLPGYGYAAAPEKMVQAWTRLIHDYLRGRVQLKRVFLLIDSRHGLKEVDVKIMKMLDAAAVSYQIILTKIDKISKAQCEKVFAETVEKAKLHVAAYPEILVTSSEKNIGIEAVRAQFVKVLKGI